ncbi:MAG: hypothetical protein CR967_01920 [Proteobacteria bacterium]|nr:MAG: hypothetical protein CR967_01920 [Pseudomonadota bacterium]
MNNEQKYEWDLIKEKLNIVKYGVDFTEARSVFADECGLVIFDESHSEYEERFLLLGLSQKHRILLVVHCYRDENATIRIISSRKATKKEQKQYKDKQ